MASLVCSGGKNNQTQSRVLTERTAMADQTSGPVAVPVTDLQITKKHTTIVVEPTAAADGFDENSYDSADVTTMLWVQNPSERWVEIPIPFATENFSASIAVVSAGADAYEDRVTRVKRIKGDRSRYMPYLQKLGIPADVLQDPKKVKDLLEGFRVGMVYLPAGEIVIRIQVTMMIERVPEDMTHKTYRFRAYAPLPSFVVAGGRVPMTLMTLFKGDETIKRVVTKADVSNPFGDAANPVGEPVLGQVLCEDIVYCWKWQTDPVVDFEYHYE
jgi:hypothetical protein